MITITSSPVRLSLFTTAFLLFLSSGYSGDLWEPNDSLAQSQELKNQTINDIHTFSSIDSATDEDWLHLSPGGITDKWVSAWIEDLPGGQEGADFDTKLELINGSTGAKVDENDDIGSIRQSGLAGSSFPQGASPTFRVLPFAADDLGPYRLYTLIRSSDPSFVTQDLEPNDNAVQANSLPNGNNFFGTLSGANDEDWINIANPFPLGSEFGVAVKNESSGVADFVVEVFDSTGTQKFLPRLNHDGGTGADDFLVFPLGTINVMNYRIRITSRSGSGNYRVFTGFFTPTDREFHCTPLSPVQIPDNDPGGADRIITVNENIQVDNLNVLVGIEHQNIVDLRLELTHIDSGNTSVLYDRDCFGPDLAVTFDESGRGLICPQHLVGDRFVPSDSFNPFLGKSVQGDWRLRVVDQTSGDTGEVDVWCLEFEEASQISAAPFNCNSPYTGPMSGPIQIKDSTGQGVAFTEDTIVISDQGTIADMNVFVDVTHDSIAQVGLSLTNLESGLSVPLYAGTGCNGKRVSAVFDDEGAAAPCPAIDPMTPILPNAQGASLDTFENRQLAGTWVLRVTDANPGDTGTLNQWCLLPTLQTATSTPTSTPTATPTPTTDVGFNCNSPYTGPMGGAVQIPDATPQQPFATLEDTIVITDPGTIADIDVFVDITHASIDEVSVALVRVDQGLIIPLYSGIACSATRLSAVISDEGQVAPCPANNPSVPIQINTGQSALDELDGRSLAGTWTLQVTDSDNGNTGTLNQWCLIATLETPTSTPTLTPTATPTPTTDVAFNCHSPYTGPMAGPLQLKDATGAGLARTSDSIVVADMGTILDVNVFVDITHDSIGEIGVSLIHEQHGLRIPVYSDGLCSATRISAVIDDEGVASSCPAIDPITPIMPPDVTFPLSDLDNRELAGTWTLEITDGNQGNSGVLNKWCLIVNVQSATGTPTFTHTPTETFTGSPTATPSNTPTGTLTITPTFTPTGTLLPCSNSADLNTDTVVNAVDLIELVSQLRGNSPNAGFGSADLNCDLAIDEKDQFLFINRWKR